MKIGETAELTRIFYEKDVVDFADIEAELERLSGLGVIYEFKCMVIMDSELHRKLVLSAFDKHPTKFRFETNGYDLRLMLEAWHVNAATTGLVWEVIIASVALAVWILAEVYVRKDYWVAPVCIAATFCIGVSCGLPLYLYLRARPIL